MFKLELTRGQGWDAPALAVREIADRYIDTAEKVARLWLQEYQKDHPQSGANGYRILDEDGARLKASTT